MTDRNFSHTTAKHRPPRDPSIFALREQARRLRGLIEEMGDKPHVAAEDHELYEAVMREVEQNLRGLKK